MPRPYTYAGKHTAQNERCGIYGKRDLFSKQIKYFFDGKELNNLNLVSIIENWFRFSEFSKILEQEDNIFRTRR